MSCPVELVLHGNPKPKEALFEIRRSEVGDSAGLLEAELPLRFGDLQMKPQTLSTSTKYLDSNFPAKRRLVSLNPKPETRNPNP